MTGDRSGPWRPLEETFRGPEHRVAVVDLGAQWASAELRITAADSVRAGDLSWKLVTPRYPDAGRQARAAAAAAALVPPTINALAPTLGKIGVISRIEWGARPTQCTQLENDWYRMAVHHTAGPQVSGGSVANYLKALQAQEQDGGTYCDLPYQFMVGFDGSVYEGRPLTLYSGATGGGNNDGNLAVCFVGCYHPAAQCPNNTGHQVTAKMMSAAQLLIQTLVRLHEIPSTTASIRGHRDYPGNATACPGDYVHPRLGELRADLTWYAAVETARSFPSDSSPLEVAPNKPAEVWVEMKNTGGLTWQPGTTFLAPTPRDIDSPLADPSWPSPTRAATVEAPVAPGETGRFRFNVRAPSAGDFAQTFGLVTEDVSWFADAPWGGGPSDDTIALHVRAVDGGGGGDGDAGTDPRPGQGGGCSTGSDRSGLLVLLGLLIAAGRHVRRRRA